MTHVDPETSWILREMLNKYPPFQEQLRELGEINQGLRSLTERRERLLAGLPAAARQLESLVRHAGLQVTITIHDGNVTISNEEALACLFKESQEYLDAKFAASKLYNLSLSGDEPTDQDAYRLVVGALAAAMQAAAVPSGDLMGPAEAIRAAGYDTGRVVTGFYPRPPTFRGYPNDKIVMTLESDAQLSRTSSWLRYWLEKVRDNFAPLHEQEADAPTALQQEFTQLGLQDPENWRRLERILGVWLNAE